MGALAVVEPARGGRVNQSRLAILFADQRRSREHRRISFDYKARLAELDRLREAILCHEARIVAACAADFSKPEAEVKLTGIFPVLQEIRHARRHLRKWMRPRREGATFSVLGTRARIRPEPRGVCLILAPWNYPVNLSLGPLVSALAAGNNAIIKPSELVPHTARVIGEIVAEAFSSDLVAVVQGGAETAQQLLALPFDHIFFTGSPAVGRPVMAAAAKNLSSVTLELGGKSPTVVGPGADVSKAARSIVWGKFTNNGQTCIAPDHVFVHRQTATSFTRAVALEIRRVYGATLDAQHSTADYCRTINGRHFERLTGLLRDARAKGAGVLHGAQGEPDDRFLAPTLITNLTDDMDIPRAEIFGPVLPIIEYEDLEKVLDTINARPKPLALYIFDRRRAFADYIVKRTSSGGVGANLTNIRFLRPNRPFGGVDSSGIGAAHGERGFRSFSHERAVLEDAGSIAHVMFPPYTRAVRRMIDLFVRILG